MEVDNCSIRADDASSAGAVQTMIGIVMMATRVQRFCLTIVVSFNQRFSQYGTLHVPSTVLPVAEVLSWSS
jgi:hypothetical protein